MRTSAAVPVAALNVKLPSVEEPETVRDEIVVEESVVFPCIPRFPVPVAFVKVAFAKDDDVVTERVENDGVVVTFTVTVPVFPETVMFDPARVEVTPLLYIVMVPVEFDNARLLVEAV